MKTKNKSNHIISKVWDMHTFRVPWDILAVVAQQSLHNISGIPKQLSPLNHQILWLTLKYLSELDYNSTDLSEADYLITTVNFEIITGYVKFTESKKNIIKTNKNTHFKQHLLEKRNDCSYFYFPVVLWKCY